MKKNKHVFSLSPLIIQFLMMRNIQKHTMYSSSRFISVAFGFPSLNIRHTKELRGYVFTTAVGFLLLGQ